MAPATLRSPAPVAQGIERSPPEREVAGSNPAGRTREFRKPSRLGATLRPFNIERTLDETHHLCSARARAARRHRDRRRCCEGPRQDEASRGEGSTARAPARCGRVSRRDAGRASDRASVRQVARPGRDRERQVGGRAEDRARRGDQDEGRRRKSRRQARRCSRRSAAAARTAARRTAGQREAARTCTCARRPHAAACSRPPRRTSA